ncbi:MAG: peptidoglycan bridge formation glycyltransferase FemA/FemB family protein, partial [Spirochaetales bacterium]|nr:peptidoglycan bridge formation glycyltransferase FemA/FemB family protein [Spirochaetales bacterium]
GEYLCQLGRELKAFLPKNCLFLRFDLPGEITGDLKESLTKARLLEKAPVDIQPPDTVMIPLEPPEEDLLAAMKHKTRYNIRLAEKKGVRVTEGSEADLSDWHRLYEETLRRDRIAGHSRRYFKTLFSQGRSFGQGAPVLRLLFAEAQGERVAAVIVGRCGLRATYLYGASSNRHRNLMPAYALQWHAMKTEKAAGTSNYDLFGIPPAEDENHPMHGLYRFKTGFGGRIVHRPGCWDYPLRPGLYRLYRWAEGVRNYYFKVLKKKMPL